MRKENMLESIICLLRPQAVNRFLKKKHIILNSRCNYSIESILLNLLNSIESIKSRWKKKPY